MRAAVTILAGALAIGSRRLGTVKVVRGTGRLVVRGLAVGRHRLVAIYAGTATTAKAVSAVRTLEVTR